MSSLAVVSVVIPAHNEESVIRRTLTELLQDSADGEFDVIVVPNACTDQTAEIARSFPGVRVIETARSGKAGALQLGHDACSVYPRLFLDADVRLSSESVRNLRSRLCVWDGVLACAPRVEWDLSDCGIVARRAHLAHDALIYPRRVLAGVGAYMLGEQGCRRVFPIPDIIADDEYVHRSFHDQERRVVPEAVSVTSPAASFGALVRRRARARSGNHQLGRIEPSGFHGGRLGLADLLRAIVKRRVRPFDGCCFLAVTVAERILTLWWRARRVQPLWSVERVMARRTAR